MISDTSSKATTQVGVPHIHEVDLSVVVRTIQQIWNIFNKDLYI